MLDFILLIFFSYKNYRLAAEKNENPWKWSIITAVVWIIFELIGIALYSMIAETDLTNIQEWNARPSELVLVVVFGIACGYLGYLLVRRTLFSKSDFQDGSNSED